MMHGLKIVQSRRLVQVAFQRNFGATAVVSQKASDPIQQLFVDKVREYKEKSKTSSDGLFEASPEIKQELERGLARAATQYGGSGAEMAKFPEFKFKEPNVVDPQEI